MKKRLYFLIFMVHSFALYAQGPFVPQNMDFANIKLKINESARRELQEEVDAMIQSTRYFDEKVKRAALYFPIIEEILREEKVPEDIKYLVIQESALIADAVSTSNAVGYWQFKDFTAAEMGLRVDSHIDERMNIVSSTRAAAKYFKKNNFYFNNWLYALQAYQMGAGAVLKVIDEKDRGATSMTITSKTYWYVKKYLAHKIAYQYALRQGTNNELRLDVYTAGSSKTLKNIASELQVDEDELIEFNKWIKRGRIPDDKTYAVVIPVISSEATPLVLASVTDEYESDDIDSYSETGYEGIEDPDRFPVITENKHLSEIQPSFVKVNGIPGIVGKETYTVKEVAEMADIQEVKFRSFNEIMPHQTITEGQVYYFKKKKAKAKAHYHTVQYGEDLWSISQKYGVRMSKLLKKNRIKDDDEIKPGMVLWLRYIRPRNEPVIYREVEKPEMMLAENEAGDDELERDNTQDIQDIEDPVIIEDTPVVVEEQPPLVLIEDVQIDSTKSENNDLVEIKHLVKPQETLYAISRTYGVEVMDIVNWNDLNIADGIKVGQELFLWVPENWEEIQNKTEDDLVLDQGMEDFIEYRVQPGDTLFAIARKYNVTVEDLQIWNKKSDNSVAIGEKIKIKR